MLPVPLLSVTISAHPYRLSARSLDFRADCQEPAWDLRQQLSFSHSFPAHECSRANRKKAAAPGYRSSILGCLSSIHLNVWRESIPKALECLLFVHGGAANAESRRSFRNTVRAAASPVRLSERNSSRTSASKRPASKAAQHTFFKEAPPRAETRWISRP